MTHRQAVHAMLGVTLMWSIAGVVTRQLDAVRGFEITFWRSLFNAMALTLMLGWMRGPALLWRTVRNGGAVQWISSICWCVMFTAFMLAISFTAVANVLVTMAVAPLLTALVARVAIGHRLSARTLVAMVVAGAGIVWMYSSELQGAEPRHLLGTAIALCVPLAAAVNWTVIQHIGKRQTADIPDMLPAVLIGAALSAAIMLPLSLPLSASAHDLRLLALLGVVQLAIPCLLSVVAARALSAPEISLLALLEVVFGVAWVWLGANEAPSTAVLGGGALVLLALAGNEALALRQRSA